MEDRRHSIVLIGDYAVGKKALVSAFTSDAPYAHGRAYFWNFTYPIWLKPKGKEEVVQVFFNVTSSVNYHPVGVGSLQDPYTDADILVLCYAIDDRSSFQNLEIWLATMRRRAPDTPWLLCGTKSDKILEAAEGHVPMESIVRYEEAEALCKKWGGATFLHCSAITFQGVKDVFHAAAMILHCSNKSKPRFRNCCGLSIFGNN